MNIEQIGLIAGNGKFPILFAKAARAKGLKVIAAGIQGDTSWLLRLFVDRLAWFKVGQLRNLFEYFQLNQVKRVIMAGQVNPKNLFDEAIEFDGEFQVLISALKDRKADTIFSAVADKLKNQGLELLDSTFLLKDYLAPKGTLTRRGPSLVELGDIEFGRDIAKSMGSIDVGQTVVVKEKAIVAIEAMEGTDQCIERGGKIARKNAVVIKMSKPSQDQRFDVPVVGSRTIKHMIRSHCRCLAIEAGKTLIIDREKCVKMANQAQICIVSC